MAVMAQGITIPDATKEPEAYVRALLGVLGDRDPIAVMKATHGEVARITGGIAPALLEHAPAPGEWSAARLVGHLFDVDIVYAFRWRLLLTEDDPSYPGYNEKRWVLLPKSPFPALLQAWGGLRDTTCICSNRRPAPTGSALRCMESKGGRRSRSRCANSPATTSRIWTNSSAPWPP